MDFRPHSVDWSDEKVARFWDYLAAHDASEFFSEKHAPDIVRRLMRRKPQAVVDIGCGTGPLIQELDRRGVRAVGVDSSPAVLEAAMLRTPDATFHLGSVTGIPLADASMDAAMLIEVVEHLDDETLDSAIAEARRVLRPGGVLVITTPNSERLAASTRQCPDCGAEFHFYQHVRTWTTRTLGDYLKSRGFRPEIQETRLIERGPAWEQLLRRLVYRIRRQRPRLLAIASKQAVG